MRPEDLPLLHALGDPAVHPDGDRVAVVVARADLDDDTYVRAIHTVDVADGTTRRFTHGPRDGAPRWSPGGDRLAFLRAPGADDPPQLAVVRADGGEAEVLTDLPLGVGAPAWSPDGRWVVVTADVRAAELADLDDDELARRPRRVTELGHRVESQGWRHDRSRHLVLVDTTGAEEPRQLTDGAFDHGAPVFTTDGAAVLCLAARHEGHDLDHANAVWRVPLDGDEPTQVSGLGDLAAPAPLPDGAVLTTGLADVFAWPSPPRLLRHAGGTATDLLPDLDRDLAGVAGGRPLVLDDGSVLLLVEDRGAVHLLRSRDGEVEVLVGGARTVTSASATPDGSTIAWVATHPTDPGELWVLDDDGDPRVLTAWNEQLRGELLPVEHRTYERDGVELDAWVVLPEGDAAGGDDGRVPLLVNVHGGPTAQYGHAFFDEFQVYARAGYAVVGTNPRGSSGRGRDWARAVVGVWDDEGSVDVLDLEAVADAVLARYDRVDPDRLGLMGGSYGGYATARLLPRTDRYRSAVVERGLLNWVSFAGTSDIGPVFDRMFLGAALPDGIDRLWAASPVRTADRITTPTLVLHSLEDHRCPPEQAYQFFAALRRNGVESELLLFPDESHELSRSGSPRHRVERFAAILDWHDRHLDVARPSRPDEDATTGDG